MASTVADKGEPERVRSTALIYDAVQDVVVEILRSSGCSDMVPGDGMWVNPRSTVNGEPFLGWDLAEGRVEA